MEKLKVDIIRGAKLPTYATEKSAGADLYAKIDNPKLLGSLERFTFPTGVKISLPEGYKAEVKPRSGLAKKHGIVAVTGTIDNDFIGEIGVTLINLSREPYRVVPEDRIAQLCISPYAQAEWNEVDALAETERGEGGFGHSGR